MTDTTDPRSMPSCWNEIYLQLVLARQRAAPFDGYAINGG
jgi:hypothetical protein